MPHQRQLQVMKFFLQTYFLESQGEDKLSFFAFYQGLINRRKNADTEATSWLTKMCLCLFSLHCILVCHVSRQKVAMTFLSWAFYWFMDCHPNLDECGHKYSLIKRHCSHADDFIDVTSSQHLIRHSPFFQFVRWMWSCRPGFWYDWQGALCGDIAWTRPH